MTAYATSNTRNLPLASKTPLQAMTDWHKLMPELFNKQPCSLGAYGTAFWPKDCKGVCSVHKHIKKVHMIR